MKYVTLETNGADMPIVGLGTWRSKPEEIEKAVAAALEAGYRHIDTAFNYNTEEPIGNVVAKWIESGQGVREDLFITTKLPNVGNRPSDVENFLSMSLSRLKMDYVDLYLIHMPFSFFGNEDFQPLRNEDGSFRIDPNNDLIGTWKVMEQQAQKGRARAIGLSNFNLEQVERIYNAAEIKPAVLQIEMHAYLQQKPLVEACKRMEIAVTAYSPLGSPGANIHFKNKYNYMMDDFPDLLGHSAVQNIAVKYRKTPGQILLKHLVQQGIIVIPKSGNPERIQANIDLFNFKIAEEDMNVLNGLDRGEEGRIFDFLFMKGVEKHPEYPFKMRIFEDISPIPVE